MIGKRAKILSLAHVEDLQFFASHTRHSIRNQVIVLLSLKAGLRAAWAHTITNFSGAGIAGQTSNSTTGWTIGGGVDWMFAPHWSAFLEGNYMDFGSNSGNVTINAVPVPVTAKATESNVLVGVNYHFF
jgi:opacity protein-like surface antigen